MGASKNQKLVTTVREVKRAGWYELTDKRWQHYHWTREGRLEGGSIVDSFSGVPSDHRPLTEDDFDWAFVGMPATATVWTDHHPYTVIAVSKSGLQITLQKDKAHRTDKRGYYTESQDYFYEPDPNGETMKASRRKDGRWIEVGKSKGGYRFHLGSRRSYRDPSF